MEPEDLIEQMMAPVLGDGEGEEVLDLEEMLDDGIEVAEPKTDEEIEEIVQTAIEEAASFVETYIAPHRTRAQKYFDGKTDLSHEEGRSRIVSTKVRDTIRAVKPSLMRVFMSTSKPVEFIPMGPDDVAAAEQATNYMHSEFNRLDGYKVLNDAFQDALVKKQGIVKTYFKDYKKSEVFTYSDLTQEEYDFIVNEDGVEVLESEMVMSATVDQMGMQVEVPYYSLKVSHTSTKGEQCLECIPPENFLISEDARTLQDAYCVAQTADMRVADVVEMRVATFDEAVALDAFEGGTGYAEEEIFARQGYYAEDSEDTSQDPSMKMVGITEAYMRVDVYNTGEPLLHKFIMGGTSFELLDYMICEQIPYAKFEVEPVPHSFYGQSLAEILEVDQDSATSVLRGILDNVAMVNNPRLGIVEGSVNIDDVLNGEIGSIVRMRQAGSIQDLTVPFVAGQTLTALAYLDQLTEAKSGVTSTSTGLNSDALQSTTSQAVQATVQASEGQTEVMVRNLANGMRDLFKLMLRDMRTNVDEEKMARINGEYVPIDPRVWDEYDVSINVGLGTGRDQEREVALQQALQMQTTVYSQYGPQNGLVNLTNIRNTLTDMLSYAGIQNADRYFEPMTPEKEQQMLQAQQQAAQQAAQQQQGDDQSQAFIMGEQMKGQAKIAAQQMSDQNKLQTQSMKNQLERERLAVESDLKRDQMAQDLLVDAADIYGKYQTNVDIAKIKREQAANNRNMNGSAL